MAVKGCWGHIILTKHRCQTEVKQADKVIEAVPVTDSDNNQNLLIEINVRGSFVSGDQR